MRCVCSGFLTGLILAFLFPVQPLSGADGGALEEIRVQLKWKHQFQFAGFYAAVSQGFYAAAGLDVELIEGRPELDPAEAVLSGEADFGVGTPELLLSRGSGEPVVVLGVIFQHSPYVFLATVQSEISDIGDLVGRRIMIEPQAAELYAYLERERVPVDSLAVLPHSFSAGDLLNGTVDVMSAYITDEPFALDAAGVRYLTFDPRASGIDFYGDCIFTTEGTIAADRDRVNRFYDATIRGWEYALNHVDEMVRTILREYGSEKGRPALQWEAERMRDLMHPEIIPVGYMYRGRWEHIVDTYAELGMLDADIDLDGFLYERNPKRDLRWLYWTAGLLGVCVLVAWGILFPVLRLNRRLRDEVAERRRVEGELLAAKESAERANRFKEQFLRNVTHDLRTPLNAILGMTHLLLESADEPQDREDLATIETAGKSLLSSVNELLDLSQLEAGQLRVESEWFATDDVIESVIDLMFVMAKAKGIDLVACWDPGFDGVVYGDPERLRHILYNLLGNAIHYTVEGHVAMRLFAADDGQLGLEVADTGPGIPDDVAQELFEPFRRGRDHESTEGSGLGLSIVRRLTDELSGKVELLPSEEGGSGATFRVTLPWRPEPDAESPAYCAARDAVAAERLDEIRCFPALEREIRMRSARSNLENLGASVVSVPGEADVWLTDGTGEWVEPVGNLRSRGVPGVEWLPDNGAWRLTRRRLFREISRACRSGQDSGTG